MPAKIVKKSIVINFDYPISIKNRLFRYAVTEKTFIKNVCSNIKQIRKAKKMTQVELAYACDFDKQNMQRIEAGKTSPTLKTLYKIAKALDVSVADLVTTK